MFERVTLIGRLGRDPEMRYTPDGKAVTSFSLATSQKVSKERACPEGWVEGYNGQCWELTTWWDITTWRGLAETMNRLLRKGAMVYIEGQMSGTAREGKQTPRVWTSRDGIAHASYEVTARMVKLLAGGEVSEPEPEQESLPF